MLGGGGLAHPRPSSAENIFFRRFVLEMANIAFSPPDVPNLHLNSFTYLHNLWALLSFLVFLNFSFCLFTEPVSFLEFFCFLSRAEDQIWRKCCKEKFSPREEEVFLCSIKFKSSKITQNFCCGGNIKKMKFLFAFPWKFRLSFQQFLIHCIFKPYT